MCLDYFRSFFIFDVDISGVRAMYVTSQCCFKWIKLIDPVIANDKVIYVIFFDVFRLLFPIFFRDNKVYISY